MIESTCEKCGKKFQQSGKGYVKKFCSRVCANSRSWSDDDKRKKSDAWKTSSNAQEHTAKRRSRSLESGTRLVKKCKFCGEHFETWKSHNAEFCSVKCYNEQKNLRYGKKKKLTTSEIGLLTKGSLKDSAKNWQHWRTVVTAHAQKRIKESGRLYVCAVCGYELHNEVCHIKAVSEFSDETILDVINDPNNLVYMCPTHHWEFDNGHINFETP